MDNKSLTIMFQTLASLEKQAYYKYDLLSDIIKVVLMKQDTYSQADMIKVMEAVTLLPPSSSHRMAIRC